MKKHLLSIAIFSLSALPAFAWHGQQDFSTPHTQLLLHANEGEDLRMDHYGSRLANPWQITDAGDDLNASAMPAFGTVDMINRPALQIRHADGD